MENKERCYYCNGTCTNKDKEYQIGASSYYLCENCGLYGIPYAMLSESKYNSEEIKNICAEWLEKNNKKNKTEPYIVSTDAIKTMLQDVNKK